MQPRVALVVSDGQMEKSNIDILETHLQVMSQIPD